MNPGAAASGGYVDADDVLLSTDQDLGITVPRGAYELYLKHVDR